MRPQTVTVGPLAGASANNIALSQTPGSATNMTINGALASGGVATLDKPRRVLITSAGDDSGITFTISGTNWTGNPISEVVTGANASTASSVLDYATVTRIATSGAAAAGVTVGTSGVAGSPWVRLDEYAFGTASLQTAVTGTVNYDVQVSNDDPNKFADAVAPSAMTWSSSPDSAVVGATAAKFSNFAQVPLWVRVLQNSGTGSVTMTVVQHANATAAV